MLLRDGHNMMSDDVTTSINRPSWISIMLMLSGYSATANADQDVERITFYVHLIIYLLTFFMQFSMASVSCEEMDDPLMEEQGSVLAP